MTSNERIQEALDAYRGKMPPYELTMPQAAFNLLRNSYLAERQLRATLEKWADIVLGPEENGNDQWADDGGSNLSE